MNQLPQGVMFLDEYCRADGYTAETLFYLVVGERMPLKRRVRWRVRHIINRIIRRFERIRRIFT